MMLFVVDSDDNIRDGNRVVDGWCAINYFWCAMIKFIVDDVQIYRFLCQFYRFWCSNLLIACVML